MSLAGCDHDFRIPVAVEVSGRGARTAEERGVECEEVAQPCSPVAAVDPLLAEDPDLGRGAGPRCRHDLRAAIVIEIGKCHTHAALEEPRVRREAADRRAVGLVDGDLLIRPVLDRRPRRVRRRASAHADLGAAVAIEITDRE